VPATDDRRWLVEATLAPSTLIIAVDTYPLSCAAPSLSNRTHPSETLVLVALPDALQKPGTYSLSSPDVYAWGRFWLGDGRSGGGLTGGRLRQGSIEIVRIETGSIDFRLAGLGTYFDAFHGAHTTLRCP
jgi:hypothetical protein